MVKVVWTDQAIDDLDKIAEFISRDSLKYARIQSQRIFNYSFKLEQNPSLGRIVPEINDSKIRELILGSYRIIYWIKTIDEVDVITIHHSSRLLSNNPSFKDIAKNK